MKNVSKNLDMLNTGFEIKDGSNKNLIILNTAIGRKDGSSKNINNLNTVIVRKNATSTKLNLLNTEIVRKKQPNVTKSSFNQSIQKDNSNLRVGVLDSTKSIINRRHVAKIMGEYSKDTYEKDYFFPKFEESDIKEAFNCFDLNSNGYISADELREIFRELKEDVRDEEIDEMIRLADSEGDGQVNWISFFRFVSGMSADINKPHDIKNSKNYNNFSNKSAKEHKSTKKNVNILGESAKAVNKNLTDNKKISSQKLGKVFMADDLSCDFSDNVDSENSDTNSSKENAAKGSNKQKDQSNLKNLINYNFNKDNNQLKAESIVDQTTPTKENFEEADLKDVIKNLIELETNRVNNGEEYYQKALNNGVDEIENEDIVSEYNSKYKLKGNKQSSPKKAKKDYGDIQANYGLKIEEVNELKIAKNQNNYLNLQVPITSKDKFIISNPNKDKNRKNSFFDRNEENYEDKSLSSNRIGNSSEEDDNEEIVFSINSRNKLGYSPYFNARKTLKNDLINKNKEVKILDINKSLNNNEKENNLFKDNSSSILVNNEYPDSRNKLGVDIKTTTGSRLKIANIEGDELKTKNSNFVFVKNEIQQPKTNNKLNPNNIGKLFSTKFSFNEEIDPITENDNKIIQISVGKNLPSRSENIPESSNSNKDEKVYDEKSIINKKTMNEIKINFPEKTNNNRNESIYFQKDSSVQNYVTINEMTTVPKEISLYPNLNSIKLAKKESLEINKNKALELTGLEHTIIRLENNSNSKLQIQKSIKSSIEKFEIVKQIISIHSLTAAKIKKINQIALNKNLIESDMTYEDFILMFEFLDCEKSKKFFEKFSKNNYINTKDSMIIIFNELDVNLEDKFAFAYSLFDSESSASLTEEELQRILNLNFVTNPKDAKNKLKLIKEETKQIRIVDDNTFDLDLLFKIFREKPNYFYSQGK